MDQRNAYIYVAFHIADQDKRAGAAVAEVGVYGDGTFCVAADEIGQGGRSSCGALWLGWGAGIGLGEGELTREETELAGGSGKPRAGAEKREHGGMLEGYRRRARKRRGWWERREG